MKKLFRCARRRNYRMGAIKRQCSHSKSDSPCDRYEAVALVDALTRLNRRSSSRRQIAIWLSNPKKIAKVFIKRQDVAEHHAVLPYPSVPEFLFALHESAAGSLNCRGLIFSLICTVIGESLLYSPSAAVSLENFSPAGSTTLNGTQLHAVSKGVQVARDYGCGF